MVQMDIDRSESFDMEHFEAGEYIFRQGDYGDKLYVIIEGEVEIIHNQDGSEQVLAVLGKNKYFGEMSVFSKDEQKRMTSVRTRTPVDMMCVTRADFNMLVKHIPVIKLVFEKEIKLRRKENVKKLKE
jgi:CRP-like cAMP-binding protein